MAFDVTIFSSVIGATVVASGVAYKVSQNFTGTKVDKKIKEYVNENGLITKPTLSLELRDHNDQSMSVLREMLELERRNHRELIEAHILGTKALITQQGEQFAGLVNSVKESVQELSLTLKETLNVMNKDKLLITRMETDICALKENERILIGKQTYFERSLQKWKEYINADGGPGNI